MKEIKFDLYTKIVLTVIAFALLGLLFKPLIIPQQAEANNITDVNVAKIDGYPIGFSSVSPILVKVVK